MSRLFQSLSRPPVVMPAALAAPIDRSDEDDAFGPGWYESSRELMRGLLVQELDAPLEATRQLSNAFDR